MSSPSYADLKAWDHAYVWHPFTQMQDWLQEDPIIIASGEGNYVIDVNGRRYLDGVSSLWCNVHGHTHPRLNTAITEQVNRISHSTLLGLANIPSILLAKKLVELAPSGLTHVFYSDAGATATEIALKLAFQYWQLRGRNPAHQVCLISRSLPRRYPGRGQRGLLRTLSSFLSTPFGRHPPADPAACVSL